MHVFIVYAHPSNHSFTASVKETLLASLSRNAHTYEISDLYEMNFSNVLSKREYNREAYYDNSSFIPEDVLKEQQKIQRADVIIFIYPVFWSECPSILTGWFQRVWTYGFAYGDNAKMKQLNKAICLLSMGGDLSDPIHKQQVEAMKIVMLKDRINNRAKQKEMIIFDKTSRDLYEKGRNKRLSQYLKQVDELGKL